MKGPTRDECIAKACSLWPCKHCGAEPICRENCGMKKSYKNFYNKLGKGLLIELLPKLINAKNKTEVLELLDQYNQYYVERISNNKNDKNQLKIDFQCA